MPEADLVERRAEVLGAGYSTFYDQPLHLVRGEGVHLYDSEGREYLDCYNNVASVGHCHPRVVDAICRQAATLNTHTRYLHETVVELAERLGEKLPGELGRCWFTCSGTEANDLAVQVARAATGSTGVIVFEGSYHGNSTLVHALSPEDCPPAQRPDWVIAVEPPDTDRGPSGDGRPEPIDRSVDGYVDRVRAACAELGRRGHGVAALLVDTTWEAVGLIVPPDRYLPRVADVVHGAGGLVIADEVQAGYCRLGDAWWGHERYGSSADIVTMGKPMGAGHPIAACVTTPDISAAFGRARSYFNTYGGNPVSAAAALAVIEVIDAERLLDNATSTGAYLGRQLRELSDRHRVIARVRGAGMFRGLDLASDRHGPLDAALVERFVSELARRGLLVGRVGRHGNVVKVRPPLTFTPGDVDDAVAIVDQALADLGPDLRRLRD